MNFSAPHSPCCSPLAPRLSPPRRRSASRNWLAPRRWISTAKSCPFLSDNCLSCHCQTTTKGGLNLETPALMLKGGENGPSIVPKKGAESLLLQAAAHLDDDLVDASARQQIEGEESHARATRPAQTLDRPGRGRFAETRTRHRLAAAAGEPQRHLRRGRDRRRPICGLRARESHLHLPCADRPSGGQRSRASRPGERARLQSRRHAHGVRRLSRGEAVAPGEDRRPARAVASRRDRGKSRAPMASAASRSRAPSRS